MDMLSDNTIYCFNAWTAVVQDAVVLNYIFVGNKVTSHILPSKANRITITIFYCFISTHI